MVVSALLGVVRGKIGFAEVGWTCIELMLGARPARWVRGGLSLGGRWPPVADSAQ